MMSEANSSDHLAEIDKIGERWLDDGRVPALSSVPSAVYHYTDANGLLGMLRSGKVWLTDFRFLNDKSEFVYTNDLIDSILYKQAALKKAKALTFIEDIIEFRKMDESSDAFVFSLSERGDDLSQWRGYAQDGLGFTLGLDAKKLYNFANMNDGEFNFSRVEYERNTQISALEKSFDDFVDYIEGHKLNTILIRKAAEKFEWMATSRGAINKHASFSAECEWRIYLYNDKDDLSKKVRVRPSGLKLVPYVEPSLSKGNKLPIKSIGIGPGFVDVSIKDAASSALRQYGYDGVEIYSADTPYRRN